MPVYSYRAITPAGAVHVGTLERPSRQDVALHIRQLGMGFIDATETKDTNARNTVGKASGTARKAVTRVIGEIAVLLNAGMPLDRALVLAQDNINDANAAKGFGQIAQQVKEGMALSATMAAQPQFFSPMAIAMTEAGEASGELGDALAKLSGTLERAEDLRATLVSAMIYPVILLVVSISVILLILLFVVPQFQTLLSTAKPGQLPAMTVAILGTSQTLQDHGVMILIGLGVVIFGLRQWLKSSGVRGVADRLVLKMPLIGTIVTYSEAARFSRVLSSLVQGGVGLPQAMAISQRSLQNSHIAGAVRKVTDGLKEGGGLSGPLAATGIFPKIVLGFFRTGEETAQLGLMLERLADVLDKDVQTFIKRFISILTPLITVVLGGTVAFIIASIMTAILGFNDLALGTT
jgi:general secretion pathway protein F